MSRSRKLKKAAQPGADPERGQLRAPGAAVSTNTPRVEPEPLEAKAEPLEAKAEPLETVSQPIGTVPEPVETEQQVAAQPAGLALPFPESPEPANRGTRRRLRILGLVVVMPAAFIVGLVVPLFALTNSPDSQPHSPAPASALSVSTKAKAPPSSRPTVQPKVQPVPGSLTGLGQSRAGILVQAQADAQGNLEVVELVRFDTPQRVLTLGIPSLRGVTGDAAALRPSVRELQVSADGELVSVSEANRVVTAASRLELPRAATALVLRYRVENASVRSLPGPPGRALLVLPPISTLPGGAALPVIVEVSGGTVRNLLCPALDPQHQLCGHADGPTWHTTELTAGRTAVIAQVDLPAPGA